MIKIQKVPVPQVLIDNKDAWTQQLLDAVQSYGGYDKIPNEERENLVKHYRDKDIKKALAESSHYKCAFCECKPAESGNIEVEHFEPKSVYPDLTFDWDNLLPSCRKCNESKSDHDTRTSPIINPATEDPETLVTYDFLNIVPRSGSGAEEKAQNTIEVCNLNCPRLYEARSSLMKSMTEYADTLKSHLELIESANTPLKRHRQIVKLSNSLEIIDSMLKDDYIYSGYCRWLITKFPDYQKAKQLVANR